MAEGTYVKLTPEQASLQNITPGELNQPIDVARVCPFPLLLFCIHYLLIFSIVPRLD